MSVYFWRKEGEINFRMRVMERELMISQLQFIIILSCDLIDVI